MKEYDIFLFINELAYTTIEKQDVSYFTTLWQKKENMLFYTS